MMRVYHSVFAAVVKSLASVQERIAAKKETRRVFLGRATVDRQVARTLCVVLIVSLLAASSPSAPSTVAGWARDWQTSVAAWTSPNSLPAKLFRGLADSYGRYENWLGAHAAGRLRKTGNDVSAPQPSGYSAPTASMPAVPNMMPLPPDAPPVFTGDPLVVGVTVVQALHITELRAAVNQVRARAGLAAASWAESVAPGVQIKAAHILELRARLDDARTALGLPAASYSLPAPSIGGSIRAAHVQELRDRIKEMLGTTANSDSAVARLDPVNQTGGGGENPLSRNYNWSIRLVGLPGRSGLDLGLSLSYNSLGWIKRGSSISFNDDGGFPSPGFRLGFPVIQPLYYNSEVGKYAFLLITPDGGHTELRQVNASALYEAADSSHLLLDTATMVLRTTDGTELSYAWKGSDYQCTQIKDRNGNFITVSYTSFGRIDTVVDTLARTIKFNYDVDNLLTSITQTWTVNGLAQPHIWATFAYNTTQTIQTNFSGLTNVGPQNNSTITVLSQVTLNDNSRFNFDYTSWGQIWKISNFAEDNHLLNYRSYNLPLNNSVAQTDCPRFTERRDWAENWNRSGPLGTTLLPAGPEQEVINTYAVPVNGSWTMPDGTSQTGTIAQVTLPDNTYHKIYFAGTAGTPSGWQRALTSLVETYDSGNVRQRQSASTWTQDDTNVPYSLNPRVTETNVYDPAGNRARTSVTYQAVSFSDGTSCRLPQDVFEYQANATTVLRRTHTAYNLDSAYTSRRIIGLVSEQTLYEVDPNTAVETLMLKVGFQYDETGSIQGTDAPVQHDNTNYAASLLTGRGNLSSVKRYDVSNTSQFTASTIKCNTAGATVASIDPLGHQVSVSYADSFSDNNNSRNTLAFPTSVTDPDGFSSTAQYNFDFGLVTHTQSPPPAGQTVGAIKNFTYDSQARIQKVAIEFNGNADYSHTRFEYPTSQNRVDTYATIQEGLGEAHSFKIFDGHGRAIASASDHPGSTGGFSGQLVLYDNVGRAVKSSNPTETNASSTPSQWVAAGDDAQAGWLYTQQSYDWKGRPLVTTNTDLTTREASYSGCGCAGGQVVTLTDEGTIDGGVAKRRQQKIYSDVLGRTVKTEVLNWQGGSVYGTNVNTYNARDQVTLARQYQGSDGSATYQDTTITYDGYGRLKTKHVPEQDPNVATTYNYNPDDTPLSVIDARGASQTFTYNNNRHLVTGITYAAPAGIPATPSVSFAYDAVGNRISMSDGMGSVSYQYNQLSRMTSEARTFSDASNSSINGVTKTLSYDYNLAGELESITDPAGATINYAFDAVGRLSAVTGSPFGSVTTYASNAQYRAWGALKHLTYGNSRTLDATYNGRLEATSFDISGVMSKTYDYYADGQLRFSSDLLDHKFDRLYSSDHIGRITQAFSGAEARAEGATNARPYKMLMGYDAFGNLTSEQSNQWVAGFQRTDGYLNNRNTQWQYDAGGNLLVSRDARYTYDAAGQISHVESDGSTDISLDGDSRKTKTVSITFNEATQSNETKIAYYLCSSVLGKVVTELTETGAKKRSFVYAGGAALAWQNPSFGPTQLVTWEHRDPSNASFRTSDIYGANGGNTEGDEPAELDPSGSNAGASSPYLIPDPPPNEGGGQSLIPYPSNGNPSQWGTSYTRDGIPISRSEAMAMISQLPSGSLSLLYISAAASTVNANYFQRWIRHGGYIDVYQYSSGSRTQGDYDVLTTGSHLVERQYLGSWETTALSFTPSLSLLIGGVPQNLGDDWMNNDPDSIENTTPNCSIKVAFTGSSGFVDIQNGPGIRSDKFVGGGGYGLGFTVSGSVTRGEIGRVETPKGTEIVNPHGSWTIQQYVANSTRQTFEETGDHVWYRGSATAPDGPSAPLRTIQGNKFSYADFPGPSKNYGKGLGNLTDYKGEWDFAVKVIDGKQQCEVKFHISMALNQGKWTAHWGSR